MLCFDLLFCDRPFFFAERIITGTSYLERLEIYATPKFQIDSSFSNLINPPQSTCQSHLKLPQDSEFPSRWIRRTRPTEWPLGSPDLTPLDFFLWRYVKILLYRTWVQELCGLWRRIMDACISIIPEMVTSGES